jgi:hypothetical protein
LILDIRIPDEVEIYSLAAKIPSRVHHPLNRWRFFRLPLIALEIKLVKNGELP